MMDMLEFKEREAQLEAEIREDAEALREKRAEFSMVREKIRVAEWQKRQNMRR